MLLTEARPRDRRFERLAIGLASFTILWNVIEGIVAIVAGAEAESVALVGFGLDSFVEVFAATVVLWRMTARHASQESAERRAVFLIGVSFLLLSAYIVAQAALALSTGDEPESSAPGIALALASLAVMPALAWGKRSVASRLDSRSLQAESAQTAVCAYLSVVLVAGLALNAAFGLWWADPLAALVMVPLIIREGWNAVTRKEVCC